MSLPLYDSSLKGVVYFVMSWIDALAFSAQIFYPYALLYMVAAFFQGGAGTGATGLLNNLRSYLWIPIAQNAFRHVAPTSPTCPEKLSSTRGTNSHGWVRLLSGCGAAGDGGFKRDNEDCNLCALMPEYCLYGTCRSISVDLFSKTLDLDLRWHLMRKTGEVTRIMDRGTYAIQNVLSTGQATWGIMHGILFCWSDAGH